MPSISAVLIIKNEADNLHDCLKQLQWVDEIIVVDSGSSDESLHIARSFDAKIFSHSDWQGYGRQRQIAQDHACSEWILMIDADERVTDDLQKEIMNVIRHQPLAAYAIPRLSWVFGRFIRHGGWYPDYVIRLYPKALAAYNSALVHEKVIFNHDLPVHKLDANLLHYTYRDLQHYLVKSAFYASQWAEAKAQQGKTASLTEAFFHALFCFLRMYLLRRGFLDGSQGLLLATLSAHSTFVKYADLWIRHATSPHKS
ncbi:MAG: glycosyltransferase family 2 protein [Gammaproteobacteria bacterium]|nr:glycosyltransferase family 2 protein [Gammaproteobacteria bacterium]